MGAVGGDIGGGIGGVIGGIGVLAGLGGKGGDKERKLALKVWEDLKTANFDMRALSAPELQVFAEQFPELYNEVIVGQPQQVQDSPDVRAITVRSLGKLEEMSRIGLPTGERLAAETAQRRVASASDRANEAVLRDLAERHRLGAGDELAARLQANQGAQNLAAQQGSDLAQQAIQNRVGATSQAAQIAQGLRGQDIGLGTTNASLMARFNEMASQLGTQRAQENALARERAQAYNVGTKQHVGEANAMNAYQTALENLQRQNALKHIGFQENLQKTTGLAGAYSDMANWKDIQRQNRERAIIGVGQGAGQAGGSFLPI